MCCRLTCVFYIDLLCSFMLSNYDSFVNYVGTKHPKGTNDPEGTNHQKGKIHPEDMKLLIKKVRILLLRLGIGYLINIACFLIVCFVNRKTKDEGEGGFLLFCSIVIFAVCFYAFITFALVYRISRFSKDADNSKAEYKVSKYQKFMMVYKCLDVIFDIAVLLYSFILSDWQLTAFTTTATAVLCTDIVLNIIVVMKNCCSDEEKSNTYRSSETNQAFEFREMKEDGSNYIHHGSDNREESLSREELDLERLPPQSVFLSDTSVNGRPNKETDHQQKTSLSVSYEVHASSKGEEQKLARHSPNALQGCEHVDKQSMNDNLLQQTSSYQRMPADRNYQFDKRRGQQDGIPQKFSDSYDHNDEFDLRKTTNNTEFYNKANSDRPPPYSTVVKDTNNTGHNVSEENNQQKCKEKYESKKNNENKKSDLARDNLYSLESRPSSRQADDPDEKFKEKSESKRNNETKKSDLETDNLYSLESRPNNRQTDDPDEENQEEHEQKTCIDTRKSNIESSNRYSNDHRGPTTSVDVQEENYHEEHIPASTNEIHPIEDSSEYCEPMEIENSSDDVQETVAMSDFNSSSDWVEPEENIRDAVTKSHIEDCEV